MKKNAWFFIPSAYFMEGLPYGVINILSAIIYTRLNIPNDVFIFWTSWLYLPWVLKMFWAPLVEGNSTKRRWVISMQFALALCFLFIALTLQTSNFFMASVLGFFVGAFLSATHDIALDGFYLLALTEKDQAYFVGWRTVFYRFSLIFISGPLVVLAGKLEKHFSNISLAWTLVLGAVAVFSVILAAYHNFVLPTPASDCPKQQEKKGLAFYGDIFKKYFTQKQIFFILLFIFLYRFGDACLEKVVVPFMLQPLDKGGLALSTETYGYIKGTLGLMAIICGNIAGGWVLSKFGFRRCLVAFALFLVLPNFFYAYMAYFHPGLTAITALLIIENFGNGLAMMAFSVFIMYVSEGEYKTSFYAISTGLMALGMMVPNMLSGKMQMSLGYEKFFLLVSIVSLITFAVIPLAYKIQKLSKADDFIKQTKTSELMEN